MGDKTEREAVTLKRLPTVKSLDPDIMESFSFLWQFIWSKYTFGGLRVFMNAQHYCTFGFLCLLSDTRR